MNIYYPINSNKMNSQIEIRNETILNFLKRNGLSKLIQNNRIMNEDSNMLTLSDANIYAIIDKNWAIVS